MTRPGIDGFPIGQDSAPLVVEVSGSHGSIWVAHGFLISSFSDATHTYIYIEHEILCVYILYIYILYIIYNIYIYIIYYILYILYII